MAVGKESRLVARISPARLAQKGGGTARHDATFCVRSNRPHLLTSISRLGQSSWRRRDGEARAAFRRSKSEPLGQNSEMTHCSMQQTAGCLWC